MTKVLSDYVLTVEDLRNGQTEDFHGNRLKYYSNCSLDVIVIMSPVLASETEMLVGRLVPLEKRAGQLYIIVGCKFLLSTENTAEPIDFGFEDVPQLVSKLLLRKLTPADYCTEAVALLGLL